MTICEIWVIIWHPWMDLIKFFCQSVLFKKNIPLFHPYSEEDKKRDALLESKSKRAFSEITEFHAVDIPEKEGDDESEGNAEADGQSTKSDSESEVGTPVVAGSSDSA